MAAFSPLFPEVGSKGDSHSTAQMQGPQLPWAAREQRGKGRRDIVWGQGGWDHWAQGTTYFVMHLGEEPGCSWAARGTYVVVSVL